MAVSDVAVATIAGGASTVSIAEIAITVSIAWIAWTVVIALGFKESQEPLERECKLSRGRRYWFRVVEASHGSGVGSMARGVRQREPRLISGEWRILKTKRTYTPHLNYRTSVRLCSVSFRAWLEEARSLLTLHK